MPPTNTTGRNAGIPRPLQRHCGGDGVAGSAAGLQAGPQPACPPPPLPASSAAPAGSLWALVTASSRLRRKRPREIGRASCRERVGTYVSTTVVAVPLTKKQLETKQERKKR